MRLALQSLALQSLALGWLPLVGLLAGCSDGGGGGGAGGGAALPCDPPPVSGDDALFVDGTAELGIEAEHHFGTGFCELTDTVGGPGTCLIDHDGDGDLDIFFPDRAGHPNTLHRNDGGSFTEVGAEAGVAQQASDAMGCLAFDYDGDGDTDLYLTNNGPDQLLENDGAGAFTDVTAEVGIVADGFSVSAAAGDLDGDGDLDLFVGRVVDLSTCPDQCFVFPAACEPVSNLLFVNQGGTFTEEAQARGIDHPAPTLAAIFFDFDGDDDLDLFVGNDMGIMFDDRMYINDGSGSFTDKGQGEGLYGPGTDTMGVDVGDLDLNGTTDVVISDFKDRPPRLYYCRDPQLPCSNEVAPAGLEYVKWSVGLDDFDNDRDLDLFMSNGDVAETNIVDPNNPSYFWVNEGDGTYALQNPPAGSALGQARISRGAAFGDLDDDGDIDIVVANAGGPHQVLLNEASRGYWLTLRLDSLAAGAKVTVTGRSGAITEHAVIGGNYGGNSDPRLHFGLGDDCRADVSVTYPDGSLRQLSAVEANQFITVER